MHVVVSVLFSDIQPLSADGSVPEPVQSRAERDDAHAGAVPGDPRDHHLTGRRCVNRMNSLLKSWNVL